MYNIYIYIYIYIYVYILYVYYNIYTNSIHIYTIVYVFLLFCYISYCHVYYYYFDDCTYIYVQVLWTQSMPHPKWSTRITINWLQRYRPPEISTAQHIVHFMCAYHIHAIKILLLYAIHYTNNLLILYVYLLSIRIQPILALVKLLFVFLSFFLIAVVKLCIL